MMTLKKAKDHAATCARIHKEPWIVLLTPKDAPCNQPPANLYNEGRFLACRLAERDEYADGGATFPKMNGAEIVFYPDSTATA